MITLQIVETIIAIGLYFLFRWILNRNIDRIANKHTTTASRTKIVKKVIHATLLSILFVILISIFGVNKSELALFIGSVLTVIGIALFAQWSILSNITSGVIIFFNHYVKLEDTLVIMDKEYEIEGKIVDIGLFFVILETKDKEQISIPNSVFLHKMIKKK
jgi:small-conductance mechanosensitive channel